MARVSVVPFRDANGGVIQPGSVLVAEEEAFATSDRLNLATVDDTNIAAACARARLLDLQGGDATWIVLAAFLASRLATPSSGTRVLCTRTTDGVYLPGRIIAGAPTSDAYLKAAGDAGTMVDDTVTMLAFASTATNMALRGEQDTVDAMMVAALFAQYVVNKTGSASYSTVPYASGGYTINVVRGPDGWIYPGTFLIGTALDVARAAGCVLFPADWSSAFDPSTLQSDRRDARDAQFMMFSIVAAYVEQDFTSLPVGTLPVGTLPGGGSYVQAVGANQSEETWVTSWTNGVLARMAFVADTPKIGKAPNGLTGLRLRKSWKNYLRASEDFSAWAATGATVTPNVVVSPDGNTNADTVDDTSGIAYQFITSIDDPTPNDSERYLFEGFVQKTVGATHASAVNWVINGGTAPAKSLRLNTNDGTFNSSSNPFVQPVAFGPNWWRWGDYIDNNSSGATAINIDLYPAATSLPLPGSDTVAGTGAKTFYGFSVTRGKLRRDYQPTPAGSGATCADCAAKSPASKFVKNGRLRARIVWTPMGGPGDYNENFRLIDHGDETTYVQFDYATQKLSIVVKGGTAEVCNVPLWWPSHQLLTTSHPVVEFDIEFGGGAQSFIRYRYSTNGGVTWSLPFDPMGGAAGVAQADVSSSGNIGVLTGVSAGNVSDGWMHEGETVSVVPAWALQVLPTDVANVKAFFRADSSLTMSALSVSAFSGQTATAVTGFTQGTGSLQPLFNATGFGAARPSIDFDGSSDYLEAGALSEWVSQSLQTGAVYILFRATSVSSNNSPAYNNHPLWHNVGAYAGISLKTGPVVGAFNYDGNYDDALTSFALATPQVVRWRHAAGTLGIRVGTTSEVTTASSSTALMTGNNRIGGNPGAVGLYYTGRIGAIVAMNTNPTSAEDAKIMSFLNQYGGIAA